MAITSINRYLTHVRLLVAKSGHCRLDPPIKIIPDPTLPGRWTISARYITFKDDAVMQFLEVLEFDDEVGVRRVEYAIGYAPSREAKPAFLYEKDPRRAEDIVHEEHHLHVDGAFARGERMRFKTHETNFEEVFKFVIAMYYA